MAAKGVALTNSLHDTVEGAEDIYLIAMPLAAYKLLSDEAAKRNLTFAQALQQAIKDFIGKPSGPRLLTEQGKEKTNV